ncbi:hypothetical protein [Aestuariivivens sp. NBU2969]|uniref:hypothetical protein n=1 Tax=Aestuariivivens sp. NBU2969 TaxID=2873267 RepID=UPI001CBFD407|nr:hypothetical protein [Aestuariivivens sp. NBU2969]
MRISSLLIVFLLSFTISNAQISVQTVAYWDLNEEYSFSGSYDNYKVKNQDTIYLSKMNYDVNIKVLGQTDSTYTIRWIYHNHKFIQGTELARKLSGGKDTIQVVFKTNELGAFKKILNIEELTEYYREKFNSLSNTYADDKQTLEAINSARKQFENPEYILTNSIKDISSFYTFHGAKYDLNEEYNGNLKTVNNYDTNNPFDTKVTVWLDEIDSENNNYILRTYQNVNENQLKKVVAKKLNIPEDQIPELKNETYVTNRIHGSGWTTYMIFTREVTSLDDKSVEEYIIQMK